MNKASNNELKEYIAVDVDLQQELQLLNIDMVGETAIAELTKQKIDLVNAIIMLEHKVFEVEQKITAVKTAIKMARIPDPFAVMEGN